MEDNINWSIIQVNYKSHNYIAWQLKILYEFNNPNNFEVIIIDNSVDKNEYQKLLDIAKPFQERYKNIKIIEHTPINKTSSGQHGEAIEIAKININSKFTLIHDPDFFWLKKNYLHYLEKLLEYNDAVGAPYPRPVAIGQEHFPSAFGCAYVTKKIMDTSFEAYHENDVESSWKMYYESEYYKKDYDFYYDVGWKIREKLSKEDDSNFITFHQINISDQLKILLKTDQKYSYETNTRFYFWNSKIIGAHLFRGSHTGEVSNHNDPNNEISNLQTALREMIGSLMYDQIKNSCLEFYKLVNEMANLKETPKEDKKIIKISNCDLITKIPGTKLLMFKVVTLLLKLKHLPIISTLIPLRSKSLRMKKISLETIINQIQI